MSRTQKTRSNTWKNLRQDYKKQRIAGEKEWAFKGYEFTEEVIREAMRNSRSNKEAARWLDITYPTYKKYAKMYIDPETGKSLFDLHYNRGGVGINKGYGKKVKQLGLDSVLNEDGCSLPSKIALLKELLIQDGRLGYECSHCGFHERRLGDHRVPLMIEFINNKKSDWRLENLRWACYNCSFLMGLDYFNNTFMKKLESVDVTDKDNLTKDDVVEFVDRFYELDEETLENILDYEKKPEQRDVENKDDTSHLDFIDHI